MPGSLSLAGTSRHRLLDVFQHLRTLEHLQLLSDFVTHTSCRQGRNQHPFDKEQTLFLVQLCLAVFRLDLAKKEQCINVCTKITPVPLLRETTKRQNWFLNCSRLDKPLFRVILKLELLGTRVLLIAGVGPLAEQVVVQHHARNLVDPRLVHRSPSCDCACTSFLARSSFCLVRATQHFQSAPAYLCCSGFLARLFPAVGYVLYFLIDRSS